MSSSLQLAGGTDGSASKERGQSNSGIESTVHPPQVSGGIDGGEGREGLMLPLCQIVLSFLRVDIKELLPRGVVAPSTENTRGPGICTAINPSGTQDSAACPCGEHVNVCTGTS